MTGSIKQLTGPLRKQAGFTLVEMLIVVILLGILATVIVPQISVSTEDAKENTLSSNLTSMRNSIELYYYQHKNAYPGAAVPATKPADVTDTGTAFVAQLTRYTDADGNISNSKDATYKYGPYIKGGDLPDNPYNELSDVTVDTVEADITKKDSTGATTGYKFYALTGIYMAADGSHDEL
jgi:general secretion pathway protein G